MRIIGPTGFDQMHCNEALSWLYCKSTRSIIAVHFLSQVGPMPASVHRNSNSKMSVKMFVIALYLHQRFNAA
jgi:hypothetical protein